MSDVAEEKRESGVVLGGDANASKPDAAVQRYVSQRVAKLQGMLLSDAGHSAAARTLAELRRAVSSAPGADPSIWVIEFEEMPTCLRGTLNEPSAGEWAVHGALTLFAVHQQSQRTSMHQVGAPYSLGASVRAFVKRRVEKKDSAYADTEDGRLPTRFAALVTAVSMGERMHYLRQIVQLLRGESIPLDYGRLARDLYDLQNPYRADAVRLAWGRAYTRSPQPEQGKDADGVTSQAPERIA